MGNAFFQPHHYPLMYEDREVGTFTVDCDEGGEYLYSLALTDATARIMWAWKDIDGRFADLSRGTLHHNLIRCWVEERIFPRERHNAAEILQSIGLGEYDEWAVLLATRLRNRYDAYWIKISESDTYEQTILSHWR